MNGLQTLAAAAGLQREWQDAAGRRQTVSDDSLRTILDCLGHASSSDTQIADSLAAIERRTAVAPRFLSVDCGDPIALPATASRSAELTLEDGTRMSLAVENGALKPIEHLGYHRLAIDDTVIDLLVAPRRCFTIADAVPGRRCWAPAVQIPSLCSDKPKGFGDFGTLAESWPLMDQWDDEVAEGKLPEGLRQPT